MKISESNAQQRIAELGMDDMPLLEYTPKPTLLPADWFTRYRALCHEFMESLSNYATEIAFMNLSQNEFMGLLTGRALPRNTSIRWRIPPTLGGKLSIENMFLCRTFPHSHKLDRFIIEQYGNDTIWLPNPAKPIYIPSHTASGGAGGNATSDRLSQVAAQIAKDNSLG
ncbi:MAG: hypothetical protein IKM94_02680 [Alphaproteobacteria bacterium]|nr:hypothetical protein [Alphaproteobacteria bacterium]